MIILEKNIPKVIRILSQFVLARRQSMQHVFPFPDGRDLMGEGFEGERTPLSFCISQEKKGIERKGRKWIYFSFFLGYSKE